MKNLILTFVFTFSFTCLASDSGLKEQIGTRFNNILEVTNSAHLISQNIVWSNNTKSRPAKLSFFKKSLNKLPKLNIQFKKFKSLERDLQDFTLCHEVGHVVGGYPFLKKHINSYGYISTEGQADYYASNTCLKLLWKNDANFGDEFESELLEIKGGEENRNLCDRVWSNAIDRNLCYRINITAYNYGKSQHKHNIEKKTFYKDTSPPSFQSKSKEKVEFHLTRHPSPQCRLDTIVAGALCEKAKKKEENTCKLDYDNSIGKKPACWYSYSNLSKELNIPDLKWNVAYDTEILSHLRKMTDDELQSKIVELVRKSNSKSKSITYNGVKLPPLNSEVSEIIINFFKSYDSQSFLDIFKTAISSFNRLNVTKPIKKKDIKNCESNSICILSLFMGKSRALRILYVGLKFNVEIDLLGIDGMGFNQDNLWSTEELDSLIAALHLLSKAPLLNRMQIDFKLYMQSKGREEGATSPLTNTISLMPNWRISNFSERVRTIIHEVGHQYAFQVMSENSRKDWQQILVKNSLNGLISDEQFASAELRLKKVSEYSLTNFEENIAESFLAYFINPNYFKLILGGAPYKILNDDLSR